ncbi:hypothetical protein BV22DRAFT_1041553 [Leucogyrophana mollusca]|uniref:Uncharacterized protein n=1 Tax=Leucogyrophana mollusca TaxID=85980 RepID=A0ACB8AZP0_9AGAM|nr:hypothetical protein BV22DRAFT_1041553 [Leucogyrophana mollusca]
MRPTPRAPPTSISSLAHAPPLASTLCSSCASSRTPSQVPGHDMARSQELPSDVPRTIRNGAPAVQPLVLWRDRAGGPDAHWRRELLQAVGGLCEARVGGGYVVTPPSSRSRCKTTGTRPLSLPACPVASSPSWTGRPTGPLWSGDVDSLSPLLVDLIMASAPVNVAPEPPKVHALLALTPATYNVFPRLHPHTGFYWTG